MAASLHLEDLRRPLLASVYLLLPVLVPSELIFNFTYFSPNTDGVIYSGDAHASGGDSRVIQLTRNQVDESLYRSTGQAVYSAPIDLWDWTTGMVSDFSTTFKFKIIIFNTSEYGDGLAFFMAPAAYRIPRNSGGGYLGLYNSSSYNSSNFIAVEFDTFMNSWDPDGNHVGIDINNIVSNATAPFPGDLKDATTWSAKISYESKSNTLLVHLMDPDQEARDGVPTRPILSYTINLKDVLPPKVIVGFSATTGGFLELHQIISWDFMTVTDTGGREGQEQETSPSKRHVPWVVAVVLCAGFVTAASGYVVFLRRWQAEKKQRELDCSFNMPKKQSGHDDNDCSIDCNIFMTGNGPRKFSYKELVMATDNFCEERKLGQGGFGGVYMGFLGTNMPEKVAVKKISRNSSQGKKEYISEVTAISQLRHRNLVRLIGWCHEDVELLLVYEYMLNGSLDMYLFGRKKPLAWALRNKIAVGLATALLYLHEEWDQCVVHRDIKASNVMLDSDFNAKLGDFGLARLVDHAIGGQTTMLAGTMGYLAPECVMMGRASKESDVYSFGVVALEIACGRKSIEPTKLLSEVKLVDWVWEQYGNLTILAAADQRLNGEYDHEQMERMMVLGLWCAHPDNKLRPSIREAIQVLTCEAPMPPLPKAVPKPVYNPVPMNMMNVLYDTSSQELSGTGTIRYDGQCNTSSHASSSSSSSDSSAQSFQL